MKDHSDLPDDLREQIEGDAQVFGNGYAEYNPETGTWRRLDPRHIVVTSMDSVLSKTKPSYSEIMSVAERHGAIADTQRDVEPPSCRECGAPVDDMGMCSEELYHETGWAVCETCGGEGTEWEENEDEEVVVCGMCGGFGIVKET